MCRCRGWTRQRWRRGLRRLDRGRSGRQVRCRGSKCWCVRQRGRWAGCGRLLRTCHLHFCQLFSPFFFAGARIGGTAAGQQTQCKQAYNIETSESGHIDNYNHLREIDRKQPTANRDLLTPLIAVACNPADESANGAGSDGFTISGQRTFIRR